MNGLVKNVAVLGSTGSIGTQALEVIAASEGRLRAQVLTAHTRLELLVEQARKFRPRQVVATDPALAASFDWSELPAGVERLVGQDGIEQSVGVEDIQIVLIAMVGAAGLRGTWAALARGKTVALANKETLVMAGQLAIELASQSGAAIVPVDSEHSAVFQVLQGGRREEVQRVVLTASGGAFRDLGLDQLQHVTAEDALAHPTWDMGPKITVDSATMMNKALEIVEARWLFQLAADQIAVMMHPQSVVHALVEYIDGAVLAQLSPPDMKLPIQYAFDYPERWPGIAQRIDWHQEMHLDFFPPDFDRFPALALGLEAARAGGTAGAVLSAANEVAVTRFLAGDLRFTRIVPVCRSVLEAHTFDQHPSLERLYELDRWAREEVSRWD